MYTTPLWQIPDYGVQTQFEMEAEIHLCCSFSIARKKASPTSIAISGLLWMSTQITIIELLVEQVVRIWARIIRFAEYRSDSFATYASEEYSYEGRA